MLIFSLNCCHIAEKHLSSAVFVFRIPAGRFPFVPVAAEYASSAEI